MTPFAAAVQMTSGAEKPRNLEVAVRWVRAARVAGAQLVGLPENFSWVGPEAERQSAAEDLFGPTLTAMAALAKECSVYLLAGSVLERGAPEGKLFNTSVLFGPDGARLAVYRKIHLFDVALGDGQTYRESAQVHAGEQLALADTPLGKLALSICYDLRFPELYRQLSAQGATVLTVPSAFTLMTGKDHWDVLLRARAIENQCHVIAPAQWGTHAAGRMTYGHAMIVDPWGTVLSQASDGEGFALAPIDSALTEQVRTKLPALTHRRL
ncbi:MAG: carbon-nitrogen hydrolase family protein [Myxococcaceae bacterium]|nr:carbon-nitrogen hydrolase family protein [Myxococcaceae bacterium]